MSKSSTEILKVTHEILCTSFWNDSYNARFGISAALVLRAQRTYYVSEKKKSGHKQRYTNRRKVGGWERFEASEKQRRRDV